MKLNRKKPKLPATTYVTFISQLGSQIKKPKLQWKWRGGKKNKLLAKHAIPHQITFSSNFREGDVGKIPKELSASDPILEKKFRTSWSSWPSKNRKKYLAAPLLHCGSPGRASAWQVASQPGGRPAWSSWSLGSMWTPGRSWQSWQPGRPGTSGDVGKVNPLLGNWGIPGFQTSNWNWVGQYLSQYVFYIYMCVCVCARVIHTHFYIRLPYRIAIPWTNVIISSSVFTVLSCKCSENLQLNPHGNPFNLTIPNTIKQINMFPQCWIPQNLSPSPSPSGSSGSVQRGWRRSGGPAEPYQPASSLVPFVESKITRNTVPSAIHCRSRLAWPAPGLAPVPVPGGAWPAAWVGHSSRRWRPDGTGDTWDHLGLIGQNRMKIGWKVDEDQWTDGEKLENT